MEYPLEDTESWFLERSHRLTPKRLKKAKPVGLIERRSSRGNSYRNTKTGYRSDIDIVTRSGWEADILRVLKSLNIPCEFEPYVFPFPIKSGNRGYMPDIFLPETDEYIEVKGYFDSNSRIKIKRFKKYYPQEFGSLTMIINKGSKEALQICRILEVPNILFFQNISQIFRQKISNWESRN